jgi:hypothetical protein
MRVGVHAGGHGQNRVNPAQAAKSIAGQSGLRNSSLLGKTADLAPAHDSRGDGREQGTKEDRFHLRIYDGMAKKIREDSGAKHIARVRRICLSLPESTEKLSHGEPTFFVRKKVFAMCANNHHDDGHIAVWIPAPAGVQATLVALAPRKFFRPPYVGVRGWVGIELDAIDDAELASYLREAWKLIAPKRLQ